MHDNAFLFQLWIEARDASRAFICPGLRIMPSLALFVLRALKSDALVFHAVLFDVLLVCISSHDLLCPWRSPVVSFAVARWAGPVGPERQATWSQQLRCLSSWCSNKYCNSAEDRSRRICDLARRGNAAASLHPSLLAPWPHAPATSFPAQVFRTIRRAITVSCHKLTRASTKYQNPSKSMKIHQNR